MVLQDSSVIVKERRLTGRHDMEVVGGTRVLVVVNEGGQQRGEYLQIGQPMHEPGLAQNMMNCLRHIGRMQVVMIRIPEAAVALLDAIQEDLQHRRWNFELVNHTVAI